MSNPWKGRLVGVALALVLLGAGLLWVTNRKEVPAPTMIGKDGVRVRPEVVAGAAKLEAREQLVNETVWAAEMLARDCGRTLEVWWDQLNASTNRLALVSSFPVGGIVLGNWERIQEFPHGIASSEQRGTASVLSSDDWRRRLEEWNQAGWRLVQTEFRHRRFDTNQAGLPRESLFHFSAHLTNSTSPERAVVDGDLTVTWAPTKSADGLWQIDRIDGSRLTLKTRKGLPPFQPILAEPITPLRNSRSIDPLILYDLDGDGLSEILLPANNLVFRRRGPDHYESAPLCAHAPGAIDSAVVGDFDGDGIADLLCHKFEGLFLFKGSARGTFDEPERLVFAPQPDLNYPMALTCGDVDLDGDLDVFLVQYKLPYEGGAMPTPFYDANDGFPAYLLLNDGHGMFHDATDSAGLGRKRWRRSFGASLVDLSGTGNLDLVVVSDFAGIDLYRNDGHGHFIDVTRDRIAEPHLFGMALALADFNLDGRLDLLVTGMTSPTADRLDHLDLYRPGSNESRDIRRQMTFGNRLYLARPGGGYEQTSLNDSIARSGWSWGCSAFDFDNDGFTDVYIANGMDSKESVRDYEGELWLHDIDVANSNEDPVTHLYLRSKYTRLRGHGESHGGYEKNRLFLNQLGRSFLEVGHLMGVALEADSRNVVSDDLDGDGRVDLLVTGSGAGEGTSQTLHVFKNTLSDSGNWIGFRFRESPGGPSPDGVQATVRFAGGSAVRAIVTGDSYRSQHAKTLHFGLGRAQRVETVEVKWPGGESLTLREPALNQYHFVSPPVRVTPPRRVGRTP